MKKRIPIPSPYEQYLSSLPPEELSALVAYFTELNEHVMLPRASRTVLNRDFEAALLHYAAIGLPLNDALARLDVANLGGFYARPPILWYALDDAAKIYPLSMKHGQMAVFRLSVYLKEDVVPALLQLALTFTIKRFPSFATTVKKGFFWHYLDTAKRRYCVEPETGVPCRPLKISRSGSQSFRVLYYNNRISVEYFHVLTDGTGGMVFLKTLVCEYLRLLGIACSPGAGVLSIKATPSAGESANAFSLAERAESASGFVDKPAVQMSGRLSNAAPCRVLHFKMDAERLRSAAKSYGATITAYMLALLFLAGKQATDELSGMASIQVPVNMRKFYPSETLRNFSMYCGIRLPIDGTADMRLLIEEISRQLAEKTSQEAMGAMMCATERMVAAMRYIPLFIKVPAARIVYGFLGDRIFSNTLSNLGVVELPPEAAEAINSMDFVLGAPLTNRASCAMVTFGGTATLSITKRTADPSFEEVLFTLLTADGIGLTVEGSELYEN